MNSSFIPFQKFTVFSLSLLQRGVSDWNIFCIELKKKYDRPDRLLDREACPATVVYASLVHGVCRFLCWLVNFFDWSVTEKLAANARGRRVYSSFLILLRPPGARDLFSARFEFFFYLCQKDLSIN